MRCARLPIKRRRRWIALAQPARMKVAAIGEVYGGGGACCWIASCFCPGGLRGRKSGRGAAGACCGAINPLGASNDAVRHELQARGAVNVQDHTLRILVPRQELTGAERQWASRYEPGDVIRYARGSRHAGIEPGSYARVVAVNPAENLLSVEKQNAELVTYDPKRLRGVSVYREMEREFAIGDRVQFTSPDKRLQVANRDLATIEQISTRGEISARLDDGRTVMFPIGIIATSITAMRSLATAPRDSPPTACW